MRGDKISQERLYCFSLYCEGNLQTKSFAFATVRKSEKEAKKAAMNELKQKFPPEDGWRNYDMSYLVVPDETILFIAKLISGGEHSVILTDAPGRSPFASQGAFFGPHLRSQIPRRKK